MKSVSILSRSRNTNCYYQQNRDWDLLPTTDTRVYVHETLTLLTDIDLDGEFTVQYGVSRVNFYEQLDYYDLDDFDRDGYLNDDDAFPTDETEWADVNGNGIGDNIDPEGDKDGDGVTNPEDAFPEDPAASQDSDGDGYPDSWNEDATEQMIADSNLTLDAFPYDANEAIDSDLDGIGNNADTDDDNDGLSDIDEIATGTDPFNRDSDGDGTPDGFDDLPLDNSDNRDTDGDGIGDLTDNDDDNDGILDTEDLFPR